MTDLNFRLFVAILFALALTILPLPDLLTALRPPWVLIFVLYLQFFLPYSFNFAILILVGLALDVLLSTVLGEHVFALSLVTWLASNQARRFRLFSIGQQMILIGFFSFFYQFIIWLIDASFGYQFSLEMTLGSSIITVLLWPWVRLVADESLGTKIGY